MALRESRMMALGTAAPDFELPDPGGQRHRLSDFAGSKVLLVAFICNHCPYVIHVLPGLAQFARDYAGKGLAIVAISANDVNSHPQDGPRQMGETAARAGFTFPYLYDESQRTALACQAICTPDFFLFDAGRKLAYRGRFDDSRPGSGRPVTGADLRLAADAVLAGKSPAGAQQASMGCSIKWKPGNAPDWA